MDGILRMRRWICSVRRHVLFSYTLSLLTEFTFCGSDHRIPRTLSQAVLEDGGGRVGGAWRWMKENMSDGFKNLTK